MGESPPSLSCAGIRGSYKATYPLFGLSELGNTVVAHPINPNLSAAVGNHSMPYMQMYTPMVKPMQERVPFSVRPHLLCYLLGERYVRTRPKFSRVWDEVETERTRLELLEACRPNCPMEARLEVVLTGEGPSILSSFDHRAIARLVLTDGLLVKVSNAVSYCVRS